MLRTRHCIRRMQYLCNSNINRRLSTLTEQSKTKDSVYSLPYTYETPIESLLTSNQLVETEAMIEKNTAEAASIEEKKKTKTPFDVYHGLILDSGNAPGIDDTASMKEADAYNRNTKDMNALFQRQLTLEQELNHETTVQSIRNTLKLTEMGKSANLKSIQKVVLGWYGPFVARLEEKKEALGTMYKLETKINNGKGDKQMGIWKEKLSEKKELHPDLTKHGPILTFLPSEKLAVITMNAVVNNILSSGNRAKTAELCRAIADAVETEVNLAKSMGQKLWVKAWQKEQVKDAAGKPQIVKALGRQIRKYYDLDAWDLDTKLKVGGALVEYLKSVATVDGLPALVHETPFVPKLKKKVGILRLTDEAFKIITEESFVPGQPKFLPMLVPPSPWIKPAQAHKHMRGGYLLGRTPFLRYRSKSQIRALQNASVDPLLEGLNFLGSIPWMMNTEVCDVAKALYAKGEVIGEIPSKEIFPMPDESECYISKKEFDLQEHRKKLAAIRRNKNNLSKEEVALQIDELTFARNLECGEEKEEEDEEEEGEGEDDEDESPACLYEDADEGHVDGVSGTLTSSNSSTTLTRQQEDGEDEMVYDKNVMKYLTKKVLQKNQNNHSLRCDIEIKFSIVERFRHDTFYFPWNLDFRGRAYPVPPNLSHMGSDICRGMLTFAEPKALGPKGLAWLKCHLCNLFGYNKTNFDTRVQWSDDHIEEIFDSAKNPLEGNRFWATSENPFQSLATCIEIYKAMQLDDPAEYMCHLPVHQDGSCNGLQHYAALGRDRPGGQAVNLMPSEKPQDVYSEVLALVLKAIDKDVLIPEDEEDLKIRKKGVNARLIHGHVNRKVIKQTVMTSVYGVTLTGARDQIMGKLKDKIYGDEMINRVQDDELFSASSYMAHLTIDSLGDMFSSANQIMDWLAKVALLVAAEGHVVSWTTPLGLPVMQPYVKRIPHTVKTLLQSITLSIENDALPVSAMKQKSAFPPNYVHSLDSTHMLMTGLRMKERGLSYTAVHDSYWTHASDVDTMNADLRECFIELYKKPLLEDLKTSLELRYPNITIPPVPGRGELDIDEVKKSRYFFH